MVSDIIFTPDGKRTERVVYAPVNTLERLILTPEDMQDLKDVQPFVLTSEDVSEYYIRYLGHEQVDEVPCYVFAVKPKQMNPAKRYFEGEVWVDDKDLQIVKTYGRGVGNSKNAKGQQFPKFETYREQIDGKILVPDVYLCERHSELPRGSAEDEDGDEVRGLQTVQERREHQVHGRRQQTAGRGRAAGEDGAAARSQGQEVGRSRAPDKMAGCTPASRIASWRRAVCPGCLRCLRMNSLPAICSPCFFPSIGSAQRESANRTHWRSSSERRWRRHPLSMRGF